MNEEYLQKIFEKIGLDKSYYNDFKKDMSTNAEYNKKVFNKIGIDESYYDSFKKDTGLMSEVTTTPDMKQGQIVEAPTPVKKKDTSDSEKIQPSVESSSADIPRVTTLSDGKPQSQQAKESEPTDSLSVTDELFSERAYDDFLEAQELQPSELEEIDKDVDLAFSKVEDPSEMGFFEGFFELESGAVFKRIGDLFGETDYDKAKKALVIARQEVDKEKDEDGVPLVSSIGSDYIPIVKQRAREILRTQMVAERRESRANSYLNQLPDEERKAALGINKEMLVGLDEDIKESITKSKLYAKEVDSIMPLYNQNKNQLNKTGSEIEEINYEITSIANQGLSPEEQDSLENKVSRYSNLSSTVTRKTQSLSTDIDEMKVSGIDQKKPDLYNKKVSELNSIISENKPILERLEKEISTIAENGLTDEQRGQYNELVGQLNEKREAYQEKYNEVTDQQKAINQRLDELAEIETQFFKDKSNKMRFEQNLDLLKRSQDTFDKLVGNLKVSAGKAVADFDYAPIALMDALAQATGSSFLKSVSEVGYRTQVKPVLEDVRATEDSIAKPMSIKDVNSPTDLLYYTTESAVQFLPDILSAMATGAGAPILYGARGLGGKGVEIRELEKQGKSINAAQKLFSLSSGFSAEFFLSRLGTVKNVQAAKSVFQNTPTAVRHEAYRNILKRGVKEGTKGFGREVGEEVSIETISMLDSQFNLGDKNAIKEFKTGFVDLVVKSGLMGSATTSLPHVVGIGSKFFYTQQDRISQKKRFKEVFDILQKLDDPDVERSVRKGYRERLAEALNKSQLEMANVVGKIKNLNESQIEELSGVIAEMESDKRERKEILADETISKEKKDEYLKPLEKKIKENANKRDAIMNDVDADPDTVNQVNTGEADANTIESEDVDIDQDEIEAYKAKIDEKEKRRENELERQKKLEEQRQKNNVSEDAVKKEPEQTTDLFNLMDLELVDENGNSGVVQERGNSGELEWVSDDGNKVVTLGKPEDSSSIVTDMGLKIKLDDFESPVSLNTRKEEPMSQEESSAQSIEEITEMEQRLEEETNQIISESLKQAEKERRADRTLPFKYKGKEYRVREKSDGTYAVSQKNDSGKFVPRQDESVRNEAISEYQKRVEERENQRLEFLASEEAQMKKDNRDVVERALDSAISALNKANKRNLNAIGIVPMVAEQSLKLIRAAYKAGKSLSQALSDGYDYAKQKGYKGSKTDFEKWALNSMSKAKTDNTVKEEAKQEPKKPKTEKAERNKELDKKNEENKKAIRKEQNTESSRFLSDAGQLEGAMKVDTSKLNEEDAARFKEMTDKILDSYYHNQVEVYEDLVYFFELAEQQRFEKESSRKQKKPKEPKKLSKEEITKKQRLVESIFIQLDFAADFSKVPRAIEDTFSKLIGASTNALNKLTIEELEALDRSIKMATGKIPARQNQGIISGFTYEVVRKITSEGVIERLEAVTKDRKLNTMLRYKIDDWSVDVANFLGKPLGFKDLKKKDRQKIARKFIETTPLRDLELIFRGQKGSTIFDLTISDLVQGFGRYDNYSQAILTDVTAKIKAIGIKNQRDFRLLNIKMKLIALQEFNENNPESLTGVNSVEKIYRNAEYYSTKSLNYKENTFDELKEVYFKIAKKGDGSIDAKKAKKSLSDKELDLYNHVMNTFDASKHMVTESASMSGKLTIIYDNFVNNVVDMSYIRGAAEKKRDGKNEVIKEIEKQVDNFLDVKESDGSDSASRSATKQASSTKKRMQHDAPLSFDFTNDFINSQRDLARSFYMGDGMRTFKMIMKGVQKPEAGDTQKILFGAIEEVVDKVTRNMFVNDNFDYNSWEKAGSYLTKKFYQSKLASIPRAGLESLSSGVGIAIKAPQEFANGTEYILGNPKEFKQRLEKIKQVATMSGASQVPRMFRAGNSAFADYNIEQFSSSSNNMSPTFLGRKAKQVNALYDSVNNGIERLPDKLYIVPVWFGIFQKQFAKESGQKLDVDRFITDTQYRLENTEAIRKARTKADESSTDSFGTLNPYEGIVATQLNKMQASNPLTVFRHLFMRFQLTEYSSIIKGINAAMGKHELSRAEGARLALSAGAKMSAYNIGLRTIENFFIENLFALLSNELPEEENDESYAYEVIRGIISSVVAPMLLRRLDNIGKAPVIFGLEYLNEEFGEGITREVGTEFDSYKNGVLPAVLMLRTEDKDKLDNDLLNLAITATGQYAGVTKSSIDFTSALFQGGIKNPIYNEYIMNPMAEKIRGSRDAFYKAKGRGYERDKAINSLIQLMSYTVPMPFPRDIRKISITNTYKGLRGDRSEKLLEMQEVLKAASQDIKVVRKIKPEN